MNYPKELSETKILTSYYYTHNGEGGVIYKISSSSNECKDAKKLTEDDPIKITITYKQTINNSTRTYYKYVYIDSYIECGDVWNISEHTITPHICPSSSCESLYDKYKSLVLSYMTSLMEHNGYTLSRAKAVIPNYFKWNEDEYNVSNDTSIINVSPKIYISDDEICKSVENYAIKKAKKCADDIVKQIDKEVSTIDIKFQTIS